MDQRKDEEVFAEKTENTTKSYKKWRIYKKPKIKKTFISRGQQYEQLDAETDHQPVRRSSTSLIEGSSATGCVAKIVGSLENLQSNKSTSCESIFADHMPSSREMSEGNKIRIHVHGGGQFEQPFQRRRVVALRRYRESAIDVPQDFEDAAYAKRVSLPAPTKRRNRFSRQCKSQEDWPKIDEEATEIEIHQTPTEIHSNDALESSTHPFQGSFNAQLNRLTSSVENLCAMGNVKAKHGTVFGRSDAVAPAISVPELRESPEETHFIRVKSCDEPREILPQRDDEKSATALRNNHRNSVSQALYSSTEHSSTIDLNSILHRNSEFFITKNSSSKNFLYSSVDKLDKIESMNENLASAAAHNVNKLNFNKNTFFLKKLNNSAVAPVEVSGTKTFNKVNLRPKNATGPTGRNCESLKSRFSGSFQNLFRLSDFKVRKRCSSEVNLSSKPVNRGSQTSSFFCPSMIFSRDEDNGASPKSGPKTWRKYLTLGVFKKKSGGSQIQDLDGGFFEKFGSLLRQKSIHDEEKMSTPLAPLPEVAEEAVALEARLVGEEGENDSGNETLHDTDSEPEDAEVKSLEFVEDAVGWNLEELYEEILYEILHNIGAEIETSQISLFSYIQDAFKISDSRHEELLEEAKTKEAPEIRLNVEVIEAKDLVPKDPNGLSDPFVTMYLAAVPTHRYNTSVKSETLNPHWEEHFSLPITDDANENILVVEVWDFDPAETVREKMNKIFDVKGVRGLRKLMKEIAVTASSGKHDNELIGKAHIPLKSIPASGLVLWYNLDKKNRLKSRGLIKIRLSFSSEKNNRVAAQEHRHLLRILLLHELETSRVAPYWWSGKFTDKGESVLTQHTAQSGLTLTDVSLVEWSVYAGIHVEHPLAFSLFDRLLDKVIRPIQSETVSSDEVKLFWEATKKLLPSCFAIIRKLRKKTAGDKNCVKTLTDVLNILAKIAMLEPPEGTDLFPAQQYGWMKDNSESPNWDIRGALKDAVVAGANDWFNTINDDTECQKGTDEAKLQHIIKLIQLIRSDLQRAIEYYDKIFQETMRFHYARTLYGFYEGQLAEYVEPIVEEITKNLKRIEIPTHESAKLESHQEINMGTTLFELYLVLKRFAVLGTALDPGETSYKISNYHKWFNAGVTHWLDISVLKALIRIEKAIELDQLVPVDDSVKYSSSAVDALAIFYQIKIFWQQLAWPDVEGSYMFVGKIVDDICRCCVFYADKMSERVEGLGEIQSVYEKKFEVTREWCLAINNIDYIRQSLPPFVKELGVDEIVAKLSDCRSPMEAQRCAETLKNVIDNAVDTEKNKILELVETVARKMSPMMRRFLVEGAELLHQDSNSLDRLMMYLEDSLKTLNMELNDVNFDRILDAIWTELSNVLYDLVQSNLDKRRPPSFFSNLRDALQIMIESFKGSKKCEASDRAVLNNIEQLLELHGFETADLIHQYYLERLRESQVIRETPYGQLTVRCSFKNLVLEIEVMNARNLRAMDSNGSCDPFVRIHFLPEEKFAGIVKPRTNAQSKTLFPLFDEKFVISLSPEQKAMKNAIILFSVKDKDLFGMSNQYIAETYLSFGEIPDADSVTPEQLHLPLTRPYNLDTDCIRALEYRIGDKQAKEFLKKLKQKINNQA